MQFALEFDVARDIHHQVKHVRAADQDRGEPSGDVLGDPEFHEIEALGPNAINPRGELLAASDAADAAYPVVDEGNAVASQQAVLGHCEDPLGYRLGLVVARGVDCALGDSQAVAAELDRPADEIRCASTAIPDHLGMVWASFFEVNQPIESVELFCGLFHFHLGSGGRGRRFKSSLSDQYLPLLRAAICKNEHKSTTVGMNMPRTLGMGWALLLGRRLRPAAELPPPILETLEPPLGVPGALDVNEI